MLHHEVEAQIEKIIARAERIYRVADKDERAKRVSLANLMDRRADVIALHYVRELLASSRPRRPAPVPEGLIGTDNHYHCKNCDQHWTVKMLLGTTPDPCPICAKPIKPTRTHQHENT